MLPLNTIQDMLFLHGSISEVKLLIISDHTHAFLYCPPGIFRDFSHLFGWKMHWIYIRSQGIKNRAICANILSGMWRGGADGTGVTQTRNLCCSVHTPQCTDSQKMTRTKRKVRPPSGQLTIYPSLNYTLPQIRHLFENVWLKSLFFDSSGRSLLVVAMENETRSYLPHYLLRGDPFASRLSKEADIVAAFYICIIGQ